MAWAPSGLGAVSGTVTSARDGAGLAGALVELVESGQSATTGPDGSYTISDVAAGTYELRVSADGHLSASQPVDVAAGATTDVDVALDPAPVVGVLGDYPTDGVVTFLQANDRACELLGYTRQELAELTLLNVAAPSSSGACGQCAAMMS